jgi:hypothetical protein
MSKRPRRTTVVQPANAIPFARFALLLTIAGLGNACVGQPEGATSTKSAIVDQTQQLFVPAYFGPTDDTNWNALYAHMPQVIVLNGPNNGPPPVVDRAPTDMDWVNRINDIKSRSSTTKIIGYIADHYGRGIDALLSDEDAWDDYGANGYFFDQMDRTAAEQDLPIQEFLAEWAQKNVVYGGSPVMVVFNLGDVNLPPFRQRTIDCLNARVANMNVPPPDWIRYVTAENYADVFLAQGGYTDQVFANNTWINQYNPRQFITLAHLRVGNPPLSAGDVGTIFSKSAGYNAEFSYVTDWTQDGNTWGGGAPSQTVYGADYTATTMASTFPGQDPASYPGVNCAPENTCLHDVCTRVWGSYDSTTGQVTDHDDDSGPPLQKGCDVCSDTVCDSDPYCCTDHWDQYCVAEASAWCQYSCSWIQGS